MHCLTHFLSKSMSQNALRRLSSEATPRLLRLAGPSPMKRDAWSPGSPDSEKPARKADFTEVLDFFACILQCCRKVDESEGRSGVPLFIHTLWNAVFSHTAHGRWVTALACSRACASLTVSTPPPLSSALNEEVGSVVQTGCNITPPDRGAGWTLSHFRGVEPGWDVLVFMSQIHEQFPPGGAQNEKSVQYSFKPEHFSSMCSILTVSWPV